MVSADEDQDDGPNTKIKGKLPLPLPYCLTMQKMALYETKTRFYLVGSNQSEKKFRILKIDRLEPKDLVLIEDPALYNNKEMKELLQTLSAAGGGTGSSSSSYSYGYGGFGSKTSVQSGSGGSSGGGLSRVVSAFGIFGFVKFLEGYYIILITKRRKVATIGYHAIYKIEDTACIYLPVGGLSRNPDELRYLKLFQSIDLSSNFYFTYSYDLTNTLQFNMCPPKHLIPDGKMRNSDLYTAYGTRTLVNRKFVWNNQLIEPIETSLHPDWILHVTHGFIGQSNVCVYGKSIYLTLIARRSARYAGTRFLKRGADFNGDVANEVETEQIIFDATVSSFSRGRFTSFVQMRGSIPAHWSQDIAKMVPKPPIGIDIADPFAETSGKHFGELLYRFGSPIVVLNLVKKRERKKHESILTEEYVTSIRTLNQFLPPKNRIHYIGFDMARTNKTKEEDVMSKLAQISEEVIRKTGFFQNHKKLITQMWDVREEKEEHDIFGRRQTGLVRVNCVDCLDRTNTAQFALGKCALAHQFRALGVLDEHSEVEFESDVIRMLEELYEDHGDTLALQYGGSQLVHRINTYRKTAPWTSQGNDIMQTLSRYYSNTFSDADKQNAINLFLGMYQPSKEPFPLWTLENDIHLHLRHEFRFFNQPRESLRPLTEWFSDEVMAALPLAYHDTGKVCILLPCEEPEDIDAYADFYRPKFFIPLADIFAFKISHSIRDFMPNSTGDYSPFSVRVRPGKRQEETITKKTMKPFSFKNPSIMGLTSSNNSGTSTRCFLDSSESDYSSSEELNTSMASSNLSGVQNNWRNQDLVFSKFFPTMKESYGVELKSPRKSDISLYKRFVHLQQIPVKPLTLANASLKATHPVIPLSGFSRDSSYQVDPPTVSKISRDIYRNYVDRGTKGASIPNQRDMSIYNRYVSKSGNPFLKRKIISRE